MSDLHILTSLTQREAISDAFNRAVIGVDRNDIPLFESAFAGEDVILELRAGEEVHSVQGLSVIRAGLVASAGPMDTTHMISNIRIDLKDGADIATMTCYTLAQHCPPGKGLEPSGKKFLIGAECIIDLVKTDGGWKIKKWVVDTIWRDGDFSVMAGGLWG